MRFLMLCFPTAVTPSLAFADVQCVLPTPLTAMSAHVEPPSAELTRLTASMPISVPAVQSAAPPSRQSDPDNEVSALNAVIAAGAQVAEVDNKHGPFDLRFPQRIY